MFLCSILDGRAIADSIAPDSVAAEYVSKSVCNFSLKSKYRI